MAPLSTGVPSGGTLSRRVMGWDLLRGVALIAVMLVHALDAAGVHGHEGMGMVALTSFFVLSGYLITTILLGDLGRHRRILFGRFYTNRAIRLLPPLAPVLLGYIALELTIDRTRDPIWSSVVVGAAYVGNLPALRDLTGTLQHLWSLAFEEQFYFIWPALLALTMRRGLTTKTVVVLIALGSALTIVSVLLLWEQPARAYTLPTTWAAPVLVGCLGALHRDRVHDLIGAQARFSWLSLASAVAFLLACSASWRLNGVVMYFGGPLLAGIACLVLVFRLESMVVAPRILQPVVWLGTISYAAYLWNYPVSMYTHELLTSVWAQILTSLSVTVLCAWLSWILIERPSAARRSARNARRRAAVEPAPPEPPIHA